MKAKSAWLLGAVVLILAGIQLVPVERMNPPVESDIPAPAAVREVLRGACYDCHSNETVWPWYSRLAPVSWLVANDVREGRSEINFSNWNRLDAEQQARAMRKAWEQVSEGDMPLWYYIPFHSRARLTASDKELLRAWLQGTETKESADD